MTEFVPPGTRYVDLPSPFRMKRGGELRGARIAYETWGALDASRGNAILILTGLSPDAHAAASEANPAPGWWDAMLGPGKPIDTDRWFVVCVNSLGSCKGSTGPASIDPATGAPYRLSFPELSVEDGADAAAQVEAVPVGQAEIEQHHVRATVEEFEGAARGVCQVDLEAVPPEHRRQRRRDVYVVLHDEQAHAPPSPRKSTLARRAVRPPQPSRARTCEALLSGRKGAPRTDRSGHPAAPASAHGAPAGSGRGCDRRCFAAYR